MSDAAEPVANLPAVIPAPPQEPWRRRLVRALLYGKADRNAKARGAHRPRDPRLHGRCTASSRAGSCSTRWSRTITWRAAIGGDAVATARPDILDRNGEILATDVRVASLFGEPKRLIDVDEAVELLTAVMPDLDAKEVRERLGNRKRGFAWLKREINAKQQQEIHKPRHSGHRLPEREQAHLSERRGSRAPDRARQRRQPGHRRHREVARRQRACGAACGRARDRPAAGAGAARGRPARAACGARRTGRGARQVQGDRRGRRRDRRAHRRDRLDGFGAGFRSEQSEGGERSDAHQPAHHRRVRDGLDLQGAHHRDGRSTPASSISTRCSMRARRCATASSTSTTITRSAACSRCRRCSPIRPTSAPRRSRSAWASSTTSGS